MMKIKKTTRKSIGIVDSVKSEKTLAKEKHIAEATGKMNAESARHNALKAVPENAKLVETLKGQLSDYFALTQRVEMLYESLLEEVEKAENIGIKMGFEIPHFIYNRGHEKADQKLMVLLANEHAIPLPMLDPKVDYSELEAILEKNELGGSIVRNKTKPSFYVKGKSVPEL